MCQWLHKHFWRRKPFKAHHWGEWYVTRPICIRHSTDGPIVRKFQHKKRDCVCGAHQLEKIYDRRYGEWEAQARADMERLRDEDLSDEPDAW